MWRTGEDTEEGGSSEVLSHGNSSARQRGVDRGPDPECEGKKTEGWASGSAEQEF